MSQTDPRLTEQSVKFSAYPYYTGYGNKTFEPLESAKNTRGLD
jgi:hypothetical protein